MDSTTGILSGALNGSLVGFYQNINITVYDTSNASNSFMFNLTINNLNDAPFINTTNPPTSINQNETFYYDFNATDIDIPYGDNVRLSNNWWNIRGNFAYKHKHRRYILFC